MSIDKRTPSNLGWPAVCVQWLAAITFLIFLYIGLYAGYNSTIPVVGTPSPRFMFVMRMMLVSSLVVGIVASLFVMVWGFTRQRVTASLPAALFIFVLYFLVHQYVVATWHRLV